MIKGSNHHEDKTNLNVLHFITKIQKYMKKDLIMLQGE